MERQAPVLFPLQTAEALFLPNLAATPTKLLHFAGQTLKILDFMWSLKIGWLSWFLVENRFWTLPKGQSIKILSSVRNVIYILIMWENIGINIWLKIQVEFLISNQLPVGQC